MRIYYGVEGRYHDVTHLVLTRCIVGFNTAAIPCDDAHRCELFGDPVHDVVKHIKIVDKNVSTIYDHTKSVTITIDSIKQRC